jgi:hypothetical protein
MQHDLLVDDVTVRCIQKFAYGFLKGGSFGRRYYNNYISNTEDRVD